MDNPYLSQPPVEMKRVTFTLPQPPKEKIDFEFQEIGVAMQKEWGKQNANKIWPMFYKYPLPKIRDAWFAYQKQPVKSIKYFYGILNKK